MNIQIPRSLNLIDTIRFVDHIFSLPVEAKYDFDFQQLRWIEPFSLLYLSFCINAFVKLRSESEIFASNYNATDACNYAGHMGFFKSFGLNAGKFPGEACGSMSYIPIEIFNIQQWQEEANKQRKYIGEIIESHSRELAQVLTRQKKGDLIDTLEFTLREIIRNVAEHSGAPQVGFAAQFWPTKQLVELAILDSGMGFKESLSDNPYLDKEMTDSAALTYALLPGISGKMYKGKPKDPYDEWQNSGFGLYMASEICRHGGSFFACSGGAGTLLRGTTKRNFDIKVPCTAIRLRLATKMIQPTAKSLTTYHTKGEKVAKEIYGANISASVASTMLTRDFN